MFEDTMKKSYLEYPVYTDKAAEIVKAIVWKELPTYCVKDNDVDVSRDELGEVMIRSTAVVLGIVYIQQNIGKILLKESRVPGTSSCLKHRLKDVRRWKPSSSSSFKMRDLSILGYFFSGKSAEWLKKKFGAEEVDALIGRPCNPLEQMKRRMEVEQERKRLEKEWQQRMKEIISKVESGNGFYERYF